MKEQLNISSLTSKQLENLRDATKHGRASEYLHQIVYQADISKSPTPTKPVIPSVKPEAAKHHHRRTGK